ncbi:MAG: amino acid adenylation domain-containing protein, partial [Chitinophagaceae bacterium]
EWVQKKDKEESMKFWKNYLVSYDNLASLPQRKLNVSEKVNDSRVSSSIALNNARVQLLHGISVKFGVTINTILQVVWGILLSKYNNLNDVVFGAVVSGRSSEVAGIESMIGLFINTIPVRVQYTEQDTVSDLLQKMQNKAIEAESYHFSDLSEIESLSDLGRDLLDHLMIFENFPISEAIAGSTIVDKEKGEEYKVSDIQVFDQNDYELYVIVVPGEEIKIRIDYSPSRYEQSVVEKIAERFLNIADQIATNSSMLVSDIQLATAKDKHQVLQVFNNTAFDYPEHETVISLFEKQVENSKSNVAVRYKNKSITYEALNRKANIIAHRIKNKLPDGGNQKIGLFFEPSIDLIACMLGVLKAGGSYVALSPDTPKERNKYILSDCDAQLLLVQKDSNYKNEADTDLMAKADILVAEWNADLPELANPENGTSPKDLVYVIYTSGTTGMPKGVEVENKGIVNTVHFHTSLYGVERGMNVSQVANIIFDASAFEIWPCLLQGACLHIAPFEVRLDPELMKEWLIENKIEISFQSTVIAQYLLKKDWSEENCNLRILNIAGDRLNYVPDKKLPFRVFNLYGPTEDSIWTTWVELLYENIKEHYSIGRPIGNKRIYIIDKNSNLVPVGIPGELCIGGDGLARGYVNDEKLTAEKFTGNPFIPGERLYRTGDFGRWLDDGSIEFFGRDDSQVKIRGFRIELGEIEWQVSSYPGIIETVVIAKSNADGKYLVGYYAAENEIPEKELSDFLDKKLPDYMIPSHFVYLPVIPLTQSGKLDRRALPEPVFKIENDFLNASNEVERDMIRIWSEILVIEENLISVNKSFFKLGGHSLKVVSLVNKINEHFNVGILLDDVFEKNNIRDLSDYLITIMQNELETENSAHTIEIAL